MKLFKNIFLTLVLTCLTSNYSFSNQQPANDLVSFLAGKWHNISFEISDGKQVNKEEYDETMVIKDYNTLTITAHGYRNGHDLTKDMHLELKNDEVIMSQGSFIAKGKREGNVYSLKGIVKDSEYRFRLYTMGDKYVFHRETWMNGKIQQIDMSYLTRK